MNIFEKLLQKISSIEKEGEQLFEFYTLLWENSVLLKPEQFTELIAKAEKLSKSPEAKAACQLSEGLFYIFYPSQGNVFEKVNDTINSFQSIQEISGLGAAQSLMGLYYKNIGQLDKAQEYIQNAIKNIQQEKRYIYFLGISYYQAGEIHYLLKDYPAAINFFKIGHGFSIKGAGINARLLNAIGTVYKETDELEKAFDYFRQALKEIEGKNNHVLESKIYADIGNYYFRKDDFAQSLAFQQKSIQIRQENKLTNSLITNYIELAELFLSKNDLEQALHYALLAEKLSTEMNVVIKVYQTYLIVSSIYEAIGNTDFALAYYKKYHLAKDEVFSQESVRKMKQLSMHHEMETMQKEKEIFRLRNVVLKEALDEIEASIRYASRIQSALLPQEKYIDRSLNRLNTNN
jgi:tetratricopeptide (TPR) repeat protein